MKLSINLSDEDVAFVDEYARVARLWSRSAAIRRALHLLRQPRLERDYEQAWEEWAASGEPTAWDSRSGDGVADTAR
ncbi:ribbon-helix-helix protein, CopG family [Blastococcus sp. CT_GayMR16]|uniref:ribbon-helix-helix protein, CopG family n=1 Tax=Blastococcus sp. CT_GayMR16 TaxID=2559607 RepID=UPI0010738511|nr:ribbon-helix-helix protein, CopG family [Blastococcus sp. CT_GayMR16]TFV87408.1 ribbon-helix-helix protein, CopG family [Blastococcus sp. CT_GayMR16]